jgi:hypothetical protein
MVQPRTNRIDIPAGDFHDSLSVLLEDHFREQAPKQAPEKIATPS